MSETEMSTLSKIKVDFSSDSRVNDLLGTCPPDERHRFEGMAHKALYGPSSKKWAMRLKCCECTAWQIAEVSRCEIKGCALWSYRPNSGEKGLRSNSSAASLANLRPGGVSGDE